MASDTNSAIEDTVATLRSHAAQAALLFDIDGVLAPIVPNANDATVPDTTQHLLGTLRDAYLVVGVVSGRGVADVDRMVPVPGLARGGNHGLEMAAPGEAAHVVAEAQPHEMTMRQFIAAHPPHVLAPHGVWLEDKGASVSLHFREALDPVASQAFLRGQVSDTARMMGLRRRDGRMVLEVLPDIDVDKGTVVRQIVVRAGASVVLYVGDDRTDMHAWSALRHMHDAGEIRRAICVVADHSEVDDTVRQAADLAVGGTAGVAALMGQLAT